MNKFLIVLLTVLINISASGQELKRVTVTGSAIIEREIVAYRSKITLNMDQVYYSNPECKSLEELKEMYFEKIRKKGLDPTKFVEHKFEFLTYGYQKNGTILIYESNSKAEIEKLASVKLLGVSAAQSVKFEMSEEQREVVLANALKAAKENAQRIGNVSGLKIGPIMSISENSPTLSLWKSYHQDYDEYLTVQVAYSIE